MTCENFLPRPGSGGFSGAGASCARARRAACRAGRAPGASSTRAPSPSARAGSTTGFSDVAGNCSRRLCGHTASTCSSSSHAGATSPCPRRAKLAFFFGFRIVKLSDDFLLSNLSEAAVGCCRLPVRVSDPGEAAQIFVHQMGGALELDSRLTQARLKLDWDSELTNSVF